MTAVPPDAPRTHRPPPPPQRPARAPWPRALRTFPTHARSGGRGAEGTGRAGGRASERRGPAGSAAPMLSPSSSSTCCVIPSASWEGGTWEEGAFSGREHRNALDPRRVLDLSGARIRCRLKRGEEESTQRGTSRGAAQPEGAGGRAPPRPRRRRRGRRARRPPSPAGAARGVVKGQRSKIKGHKRAGATRARQGGAGAIGAMPGTDAAGCATRATPPHGRARRRRRQAGARATRAAPASCPSEPPASGTPVAPRRRPLGEPRAPARNRTQRARRRRARRGAGGRGTCLEHPAHLTHVHLGVHLPHRACHLPRRHGAVRHLGGSGRRECAARRCTTRVAPAGRRARSGAQGGPWRRWRPSACWTGRSSSKWRPPSPAARPPGRQRAGAHTLCGERRRSGEGPGPS